MSDVAFELLGRGLLKDGEGRCVAEELHVGVEEGIGY